MKTKSVYLHHLLCPLSFRFFKAIHRVCVKILIWGLDYALLRVAAQGCVFVYILVWIPDPSSDGQKGLESRLDAYRHMM